MVNRGSEWHKWDLHVHTPKSIINNYGGDNNDIWDKFIDKLEKLPKDIAVIGITDYYFIDGYEKVMEYKNKGRLKNIIKIFPILEFRIDTFGSGNENKLQKINLHILFNLDEKNLSEEIKQVKEKFIEQIPISCLGEYKLVKLSKDNFIKHSGTLDNGFNNFIPPTEKVLDCCNNSQWKNKIFLMLGYKEWSNLEKNQQLKLYKQNLYDKVGAFLSSSYDNHDNNQKYLDKYGQKKLLHSNDIHDLDNLSKEKYYCNTWIKADLTFEGLKQIIYEPEDRVKIQQAKPEEKSGYQVISSVELKNNKDNSFWKQEINFNENLNTIIGGRSTGKSNLLAAIANKLSCYRYEDESDKKKDFINDKSKDIKIIWKDNVEDDTREVQFFSQNRIHELSKEENNKHLNNIVGGIIKEKNTTVIDNYNTFKQNQEQKINTNIKKLFFIMQNMKSKIESMKTKGDKKGVEGNIKLLEDRLSGIKINGKLLEQEIKQYNEDKQKINDYSIRINTITKDISKIDCLLNENIIKEDILNNYIELSDDIKDKISQIMVNVKQEANNLWKEKLSKEKEILETEKKYKEGEIEEIKNKAEYKNTEQNIEKNKEYKALQDELDKERAKLKEIEKEENEIKTYQQQIDELKDKIITDNCKFFEEIKTTIDSLQQNGDKVKIKPTVKLYEKLYDTINEYINIKIHSEYKERDKVNKDYMTDIKKFNSKLLNSALENNLTMKTGKDKQIFLITLFSRNLFYIKYQLEYENDNFEKMSDGKKAIVILTMLLEYSNKKCPVLIDQPEDSLDNRSIYNELSKYLKQKKKERQIILVTHNANIVVNTDAENVIVANQNGTQTKNRDGIKFQYINGSLESTKKKDSSEFILESQGIREHVCEILEGGKDAFYKREQKYGLD